MRLGEEPEAGAPSSWSFMLSSPEELEELEGSGGADDLEKRTVFRVKGIKGGLSNFDGFEDRVWLADSLGY